LVIKRNICNRRFLPIVVILFTSLLFSCSQTKFVSNDQYLLHKVDVEINDESLSKDEAKSYIRLKENYKILGFVKFHLLLYNLSSKKKEGSWLKRIGEAPQIYDEVLSVRTEDQLKQYANSKGYYRAKVNSVVELNEKKRKVNLKYLIEPGQQYTIKDLEFHINSNQLQTLFLNDTVSSQIKAGDPFDMDALKQYQNNIVELFRNNGYYYFSKDHLKFTGDSLHNQKEVTLNLYIDYSKNNQIDSVKIFKPYYLNNFYYSVLPGNNSVLQGRDSIEIFSDTIRWNNNTLYENKQFNYPIGLFDRTMRLNQGELFNQNNVENTFAAFNRLRQFRFVDIQFQEPEEAQDSNLLDCIIRLAPLNKQSTSFDIEGTNTSGNFGVAGNITYQHRNLFKGAEIFQLQFKGATERMQHTYNEVQRSFNTREFGVEGNLLIPMLLGPGKYINNFEKFLPKTSITMGYNFQRRPEYTRTLMNVKFGYEWKTSEDLTQIWNILDYNSVKVFEYDQKFLDGIEDLYIKSSFEDNLILAMNYSVIYNNQRMNTKRNYTLIRYNIESAGNLLWALSKISGQEKYQQTDSLGNVISEYYRVANTRYAQYIKSDFEISHGFQMDDYNAIVARAFVGIGIPYGNFDLLPFVKKYFTGGANGIRAWQVRSLGPGAYEPDSVSYPNQSSEMKLEANLEYRFKLTNFLEGALFLDAGNIWAINEKDNRPGALFSLKTFYKQIALGTGAGLRVDLNYFIFRLDLGMKLHDPAYNAEHNWILGKRSLISDDFNLSFAIGYPF